MNIQKKKDKEKNNKKKRGEKKEKVSGKVKQMMLKVWVNVM